MEVITMGETMVLFTPVNKGMMRHSNLFSRTIGGAESNVAVGLSRLGHKAGWISKVGNDEFGKVILSFIRGEGVNTDHVFIDDQHATGVFFKELRREDDIRVNYYRANSAASHLTPDDIDENYIAKAKYVHLTGITPALSESCKQAMQKVIDIAKKYQIKVIFDPNYRKKLWSEKKARETLLYFASQADIVLPGISEGIFLFDEADPKKIAYQLLEIGPTAVVLKLGAEGARLFTKKDDVMIPGFHVKNVVDPVGAGDGFAAGFISGLLQELPMVDAIKRGNAVGALVTTINGDLEGLPDNEEIERFIMEKPEDVDR